MLRVKIGVSLWTVEKARLFKTSPLGNTDIFQQLLLTKLIN